MKYKITILFLFLNVQLINSQPFLWPTDASRLMTSSFCEYRPGHFHAGLDIKTWNREGYQVFAIDSGYIKRVLVSPYGYGKALYLELHNGWTVVYGHLSKFDDRLESRIRVQQKLNKKYTLDLHFSPQEFPVKSGDCLAYTGSTGIGAPHLHFEIRDIHDDPFNPLDLDYFIKDTQAPVIRAVAVSPLEFGSHVDGDYITQIYSYGINGHGSDLPVSVWGKIGFSVSVYDQANGASNRFSPHRLRLFVNDSLVFQTEYKLFDHRKSHLVDLDRDFRLSNQGKGEFQKLYIDEPLNHLPFYSPNYADAGIIHCWQPPYKIPTSQISVSRVLMLSAELNKIRIEAEDFWGNYSTVCMNLRVCHLSKFIQSNQNNRFENHDSFKSDYLLKTWMHDFVRFFFQTDRSLSSPPKLLVWLNGKLQATMIFYPNTAGELVCALPLTKRFEGVMICQVKIDEALVPIWQDTTRVFYIDKRGGSIYSSDQKFKCTIPSDAVYEPVWFHVEKQNEDSTQSFPTYYIVPSDVLLKRNHKIQMALPVEDRGLHRAGIYTDSNRNYLSTYEDASRGILTAFTKRLNGFTILQDTVPPLILSIYPDSGSMISRSQFHVDVIFSDALSGIGSENNYQVWIDSSRQIVAYHPDKNLGRVDNPDSLGMGDHWLDLLIRDRSGNAIHRRHPFIIQE